MFLGAADIVVASNPPALAVKLSKGVTGSWCVMTYWREMSDSQTWEVRLPTYGFPSLMYVDARVGFYLGSLLPVA